MPDPVTSHPWSGNPWQRDTGQELATDAERVGTVWDWALEAASRHRDSQAFSDAEDANASQPEDAYRNLVADWPDVAPLIPRHITRSDSDEVTNYWKAHWRNSKDPNDKVHCFDYAQYQLHVAGFRSTGSGKNPDSFFQLFLESDDGVGNRVDVTDVETTIDAVNYIKEMLQQGFPVLVGIRLLWYQPRPNPDDTTNHFVVVVGMGEEPDRGGPYGGQYYLSYYDYHFSDERRFYLFNVPTLALHSFVDDAGHAGYGVAQRRVSQVRRTVRR